MADNWWIVTKKSGVSYQPEAARNGTDEVTVGKEKARRSVNSVELEGAVYDYYFAVIFCSKAVSVMPARLAASLIDRIPSLTSPTKTSMIPSALPS